jgi:hypothetical protein
VPSAITASPASQQIETWIAAGGGHVWGTIVNGEEDLSILDTLTGGSRVILGNVSSCSGTITVNPGPSCHARGESRIPLRLSCITQLRNIASSRRLRSFGLDHGALKVLGEFWVLTGCVSACSVPDYFLNVRI